MISWTFLLASLSFFKSAFDLRSNSRFQICLKVVNNSSKVYKVFARLYSSNPLVFDWLLTPSKTSQLNKNSLDIISSWYRQFDRTSTFDTGKWFYASSSVKLWKTFSYYACYCYSLRIPYSLDWMNPPALILGVSDLLIFSVLLKF